MNERITNKLEDWMSGPNEKNIIRYIISNEKVSRTDISKALSVSMSTVTNVTEKLMTKNLIRESGLVKTERGRSIKLLQINEEKYKAIGIGINSLLINVSLIDFSGKKYFHKEVPLDTISWQHNYDNIKMAMEELLAENTVYMDDILGIGIEPPGFVEYEMKNLDKKFTFDDEWDIDSVIEMLEGAFDYGATYSSSFSCILSGESYFGEARHYNSVISINVSSAGLGWAKIDGRIIDRNVSETYRSVGHMVININGPQCTCHQQGCVELYTGGEALVENYRRLASFEDEFNATNGKFEDITYHQVLDYAEKGDYIAVQAVSKAATILGIALGNLVSVLHPDLVILTGRIIRESNLYYEIAKKTINNKQKNLMDREVVIELAKVHHANTTSLGAATLVFEQIFLGD